MRVAKHVTVVDGKQDTEREKERESMRAAKQEWQQRQMEAFRNRRQVEGERAEPAPLPSPLDSPPVYAPGNCTEHALPALLCATESKWRGKGHSLPPCPPPWTHPLCIRQVSVRLALSLSMFCLLCLLMDTSRSMCALSHPNSCMLLCSAPAAVSGAAGRRSPSALCPSPAGSPASQW